MTHRNSDITRRRFIGGVGSSAAAAALLPAAEAFQAKPGGASIKLFNGKDLSGW
jgi:hypothetical protein